MKPESTAIPENIFRNPQLFRKTFSGDHRLGLSTLNHFLPTAWTQLFPSEKKVFCFHSVKWFVKLCDAEFSRQLPPGGSPHYVKRRALQSSKPFDTRHTLSHHWGSPIKKNTNQRASDCKVFSFCNRRQDLVLEDPFKSSLAFT